MEFFTLLLVIGLLISTGLAIYFFLKGKDNIAKSKLREKENDRSRMESHELILNILPAQIAEELKTKGAVKGKSYEQVSILFADIKNFTAHAKSLSAVRWSKKSIYCSEALITSSPNTKLRK